MKDFSKTMDRHLQLIPYLFKELFHGIRGKERRKINPQGKGGRLLPLIVCLTLSSFLFSPCPTSSGVPVIPNKAAIEGIVMEYCITSSGLLEINPEQPLYKLTISMEAIKDVEGFPNFLKGKEGQILVFFTKERTSPEFFGKRIKAHSEYRGDETGGRFWIRDLEIIKKGGL